jgi:hypothetical protein
MDWALPRYVDGHDAGMGDRGPQRQVNLPVVMTKAVKAVPSSRAQKENLPEGRRIARMPSASDTRQTERSTSKPLAEQPHIVRSPQPRARHLIDYLEL